MITCDICGDEPSGVGFQPEVGYYWLECLHPTRKDLALAYLKERVSFRAGKD